MNVCKHGIDKTACTLCKAVADEYIRKQGNEKTVFACGPQDKCPDGTEHDYSGWEDFENGGTSVCVKCGTRAIDVSAWY